MSGELLRRAAALMRERAEVGPDHPWSLVEEDQVVARYTLGEVVIADYVRDEWADHIASWHPAIALAVADLLDTAADTGGSWLIEPLLTVARAYLGEAS